MSEDENGNGDSGEGFLRRNRKKFWAGIAVLTFISVVILLSSAGWIPSLGFLVSPALMAFYGISFILVIMVYGVYRFGGGDYMPQLGGGASVENQLSKYEAKELMQWILFSEDHPIIPGRTIKRGVKPVRSRDDDAGTSARIFQWIFSVRGGGDVYCALMSLDQNIEFESEWVERMTPEDVESLNSAMRQVNEYQIVEKRSGEDMEGFEERIKEETEDLGQSVRNRRVIEKMEDGEVVQREEREVIPVRTESGQDMQIPEKGEK